MDEFRSIVGGKWWKTDFHLHTPGSYDYGHGDSAQTAVTPEVFLHYCMEKKLDCIVVADHDTLAWVPKLRNALESLRTQGDSHFRELVIFPGIEINVQGNVHLLGIFDLNADYEEVLAGVPHAVGINRATQSTDKSINEVIAEINKLGGIAIPAHVDQASGLFGAAASVVKSAFDKKLLLALEVCDEEVHNEIYNQSKQALAFVLGSDSHCTDTIGEKYTWVKMGEPNIEALKLALYDSSDGAIRSITHPESPNNISGRTYIKELIVEKGKCIGVREPYRIEFSPWLSCLIGGRGTGKSTVLRFLRLVLNRGDELPDSLKQEYKEFAQIPSSRRDVGLLREDTKVTLIMCVEGVEISLIWYKGVIYEEVDGKLIKADSLSQRFPVNIFSQKQLYEMTKNPHLLFDYIDAEWDSVTWERNIRDVRSDYFQSKNELRELYSMKKAQETLITELRDIARKVALFETEEIKRIIVENQRLKRNVNLIEQIHRGYKPFLQAISTLNSYKIVETFDTSALDDESRAAIDQWCAKMNQMISQINSIIVSYSGENIDYEHLLLRTNLPILMEKNAEEMGAVLQELKDNGVDGVERYSELLEQRVRKESELNNYHDLEERIEVSKKRVAQIKARFMELIRIRYENRSRVISEWNTLGHLRLKLKLFGDSQSSELTLRTILRKDTGFESDIARRDEDTGDIIDGFIHAVCSFAHRQTIQDRLSILDAEKQKLFSNDSSYSKRFRNYLERTMNQHENMEDEIDIWVPDDRIDLEIKKKNGSYKPVSVGSPGERTSAILSLIFTISKKPVIIDQPEDDLDTRNISALVVNGITNLKPNQQIILVTHNPNIVVNTNSDQVIHLDFHNGQIINACQGALQEHDVRDAICEVMEGGKKALEQRYYRIFKALS